MSEIERLGEKLRAIRKLQGMSVRELADRCGVHRSTIFEVEAGKRKNPGIQTVARIVDELGYDLDEFLSKSKDVMELKDDHDRGTE